MKNIAQVILQTLISFLVRIYVNLTQENVLTLVADKTLPEPGDDNLWFMISTEDGHKFKLQGMVGSHIDVVRAMNSLKIKPRWRMFISLKDFREKVVNDYKSTLES